MWDQLSVLEAEKVKWSEERGGLKEERKRREEEGKRREEEVLRLQSEVRYLLFLSTKIPSIVEKYVF